MKEALDLAISALSRDRWISVEDRLPEPRTDVLAAWDDGEVWSLWQSWANMPEYYVVGIDTMAKLERMIAV